MKLVIDIPEEAYKDAMNGIWCKALLDAIKDGVSINTCEDAGEISDGYHTFNQLYHQRAILFAAIINQNKDISWKSYKHSDGKYCFDSDGEWFIVGIDTPEGSYTYHYSKEYWGYFECKELDCGKEWDGHTEEDVTRLLSLKQQPYDDYISRKVVLDLFAKKCDSVRPYHEVWQAVKTLPSVNPDTNKEEHYVKSPLDRIRDLKSSDMESIRMKSVTHGCDR